MGMKIAAATTMMMLMLCAAFWFYYKDTQKTIGILQANNAQLEIGIATSEATITSLQEDYTKINTELTRVNTEFAAIREQNRVLSDKLAKHDLGVLGSAKPGLVERAVNNGTANANRCFELLSGASLTDNEKEATSANAFNSECPWLWPGNSTN